MSDRTETKQLSDGMWGIKDVYGTPIGRVMVDTTQSPSQELWEMDVSLSQIMFPAGVSVVYIQQRQGSLATRMNKLQEGKGGSQVKWYCQAPDSAVGAPDPDGLPDKYGVRRKVYQAGQEVGWAFHVGTSGVAYDVHHFFYDAVAFIPNGGLTYGLDAIPENLKSSASSNNSWYSSITVWFTTAFDWQEHKPE